MRKNCYSQLNLKSHKNGRTNNIIITILIYNNNRNNNALKVAIVDFILFADDTNIFISHRYFNLLPEILNSEMLKLTNGVEKISCPLTLKKSNSMVFRPRQRKKTLDRSIQTGNNVIERLKETVFQLGVILNEHFSRRRHNLSVSRKISKSIAIIYA